MNIVPALARIAFGLKRSVRGEAATTASTPAPSALRRTGAEVARLLDAFDHDDERRVREPEVGERRRRDAHDRDETLRPLAEGELGEDGLAGGLDRGRARSQAIERGAGVGARQERLADEGLDDLDPGVERPPDLAGARR